MLLRIVLALLLIDKINCDYWEKRNKILEIEKQTAIGGNITLSIPEYEVNNFLLKLKQEDYKHYDDDKCALANRFTSVKKEIENSKVFEFIKRVPKGASLHTHLLAATDVDFIIKNITRMPNVYACEIDGRFKLRFLPENMEGCDLVEELRKNNNTWDAWLQEKLTVRNLNKRKAFGELSAVFTALYDLLTYKPAFEIYIDEALRQLYDDKVIYAEFRGTFIELYDLTGKVWNQLDSLRIFKQIVDNFTHNHALFQGAKYIYAPYRKLKKADLVKHLELLGEAKKKYPTFIIGFDLVGFEDDGLPLKDFIDELLIVDKNIQYYFHAGETNWHGSDSDLNVLDAILLSSSRIGHGYSLIKHPELLKLVKIMNIAIEISPISNQMLNLVADLRNHPGSMYIAHGLPVVICNDDPTAWGTTGLSYDYYAAYIGMSRSDAGLEFFKEIGLNSIWYSGMTKMEKQRAAVAFEKQWEQLIVDIRSMFQVFMKIFG